MIKFLLRLCLLVASLCGVVSVFAQAVPATDPVPRVVFPYSPNGNTAYVGSVTADAANAAKFSFGVAANGAVWANTGSQLPTPGGASIPISVAGQVSKPNVAAALGRFARKTLPLLNTGVALYDLAKELGFSLGNSNGQMVVQATDPMVCTVAPCYSFSTGYGWYPSKSSACQSLVNAQPSSYGAGMVGSDPTCDWVASAYPGWGTSRQMFASLQVAPSAPTWSPSDLQHFTDAVAAKSGWPESSALARATVDAIKSGEAVQVDAINVTGPASSPGPSSSSVRQVVGGNPQTTTTVTNYNYNYGANRVTTNISTTSTTVDNVTNQTIESSGGTVSPVTPSSTDAQKSDCELHPEHIGCAIFGDSPTAEAIPRLSIPVTLGTTVFAAPSGCPSAIAFTVFAKPYTIGYDGLCNTLVPIRLIFLALGAAMAVMIFMEGLKA